MLYSFPIACSIFSDFFMYMAMPPLVPFSLRFSIRKYPSRCGVTPFTVSQVS
jgi:membrane-bound metal-dependent hydrolase YbcI (DUF457 family)